MAATEYPAEEWRIARQLVRMIGSAKTWQDMIEASDALFQVELRAKQMRAEHEATDNQSNMCQQVRNAQGYQGGAMAAASVGFF